MEVFVGKPLSLAAIVIAPALLASVAAQASTVWTAVAATRAADEQLSGGGGGQMCRVHVDRSGAADSFQITRQVAESGSCVCYVQTGPASQASNVEAEVAGVVSSQQCADAPVQQISQAGESGGHGMSGASPVLGLAVAGVAALAASGHGGGNESPGG
jgi:hypothetical protein